MQYIKPAITISQQVALLQSRGLIIKDKAQAEHYLSHISYYRLRAYTYPFQDNSGGNHLFRTGTTLDIVLDVYRFDRKLKILLFDAIERIEIAFRTQIIYHCSCVQGSHFFEKGNLFRNSNNFRKDLDSLDKELARSTEEFIKHYKSKYTSPVRPPAWMSLEVISIGVLSKIYENLKNSLEKRAIAAHFGVDRVVLESWMHSLSHVRNICAHHGRLWNRTLKQIPKLPTNPQFQWLNSNNINQNRLFATLSISLYLLNIIAPGHSFKVGLKNLLLQFPSIPIRNMGFPNNWETDPLWL
jgi:abortive infection bacteriophage resistance protein